MKSSLAASFFWFAAGTCRRITCSRSTITSTPMVDSLVRLRCQSNRGFHPQGFESSNKHVHFFAVENDEFSELGPEISEYSAKKIKLATEKWDCVNKAYKPRKKPDRGHLPSRTKPSATETVASVYRNSQRSNRKFGGLSHASTSFNDTKKVADVESPRSVLVKNILPDVGLSELIDATSTFGKVAGASFAVASNGLRSCYIEFEDADSSRKAIAAGKIGVGSREFPVHHPRDAVQIVTFRIEKIDKRTTDYAIHSRCKAIAEFMGLARTSDGAVEAFFNVWNDSMQSTILQMLNSTVVDLSKWSAHVVTGKTSATGSDSEAGHNLSVQIMDHTNELCKKLQMKKILVEDLRALHAGIMHLQLQEFPPALGLHSSGGK